MTDWIKIVSDHHTRVHLQPGDKLHLEPPASIDSIRSVEKSIGAKLPTEFVSLYEQINGFGLTYEDSTNDLWWFCHPLGQLEEFTKNVRNWFTETHPDVAARFFPFIDFANGDGMGYLVDINNKILPGLYWFEHENYGFEEDGGADEFIVKWNSSIAELLTVGAGLN